MEKIEDLKLVRVGDVPKYALAKYTVEEGLESLLTVVYEDDTPFGAIYDDDFAEYALSCLKACKGIRVEALDAGILERAIIFCLVNASKTGAFKYGEGAETFKGIDIWDKT